MAYRKIDLSIIIPTTSERTVNSFSKLLDIINKFSNTELIFIINSDEIKEIKIIKNKQVIQVHINHKLGFVGAVIVGSKVAKGSYLLVLNDDCEINTEIVGYLIANFEKVIPNNSLISCSAIHRKFVCTQKLAINLNPHSDKCINYTKFINDKVIYLLNSDFTQGACIIIDKKIFSKIFPPYHYFMYDEEVYMYILSHTNIYKTYIIVPPICLHPLDEKEMKKRYCKDYPYFKIINDIKIIYSFFTSIDYILITLIWLVSITFTIIFLWSIYSKCPKNIKYLYYLIKYLLYFKKRRNMLINNLKANRKIFKGSLRKVFVYRLYNE